MELPEVVVESSVISKDSTPYKSRSDVENDTVERIWFECYIHRPKIS